MLSFHSCPNWFAHACFFPFFSFDEIPSIVDQMIGHHLVTKQTGKDGVLVRKVLHTV